jgi:serine phosphatase RsbU (regulator of sigma subunit)
MTTLNRLSTSEQNGYLDPTVEQRQAEITRNIAQMDKACRDSLLLQAFARKYNADTENPSIVSQMA